MRKRFAMALLFALIVVPTAWADGPAEPRTQPGDYAAAMKDVAGKFHGRPGVVLHVGDSITYSNPYGQWARAGKGQTPEDRAVLAWMHRGADNDTDGWWLARFDCPEGGRSYTACSGIRADEMLAGGKRNLPPLHKLLDTYRPQMVVLMLGTNDASANRPVAAYRADMEKAVNLMMDRGIICILSTIPPHPRRPAVAKAYNEALRQLARQRGLPLIDYEQEILRRRPDDWNGTLLQKNDVHPTASQGGATPASAPTAENLRNSGYLLRGWLTVRKVAEVKRKVLDDLPPAAPAPEPARTGVPAPKGQAVRVPVTRDTTFSSVGAEADCNLGGAARLKLKSYQEMSLIDVNPAPLRGRVIAGATLHLRLADKQPLRRVTVSTFAADWVEGTSAGYAPQKGSSSFHHRQHPDVPWTVPGSDLCSVMLGEGGTVWRMADAFPPDAQGWQRVAVDPVVVAARVAGLSQGFLLFDDTGSEWTRQGEQFTFFLFPNRFVYSRESGPANAPYLTVFLGAEDREPPAAPGDLRSEVGELPAGEAWVSWGTPEDKGPAGTVGFFVSVDGKDVPRYLIPPAGKAGERVRMHLRDLALTPGAEVRLAVRAVDGAGNIGAATEASVRVSDRKAAPLPGTAPKPFSKEAAPLPRLGGAEIAILDELDKVHPVTAEMIPKQPEGYLATNHLWDARRKQVRLHAARNEFVAFQVLLRGPVKGVRPALTFDGADGSKIRATFGRYRHVLSARGPLPDPIESLSQPLSVPEDEKIAGQKSGSLYCEVYVPHELSAGPHQGRLTLESGGQALALPVALDVWNFTLPDYLSFLPEMNCYGLPANERDYYRLAHRHRTFLNRVPYHHSGAMDDGCAPVWHGQRLDWSAWDRRFGPYFDGSAFADLPRKEVPLEAFYLPLFENWPDPMEGNYNGNYWADRAFPPRYRQDLVTVSRQMAEHFSTRGWHDTFFEFFLNGKNNFKRGGWSRGTSPWLLDEPASWQDFWALRYFGTAFHEGIDRVAGQAKLAFRCDISRPQWQRNSLDGLLDVNVVGGAMRPYHRQVFDRQKANGEVVIEYGSSNAIEDSNVQPVGWSLDSWALGSDGVLPWQTIGSAGSWEKADQLSLFYPGRGGAAEPVPSIRLKAFRRGQQDVEYLTLLARVRREPRWVIGLAVREALHLSGQRGGTDPTAVEDAGVIDFAKLRPQDVWALRVQVGQVLSEAGPPAQRRLVELRTPPRDVTRLAPGYVSVGEVPGLVSTPLVPTPAAVVVEKGLPGR